ncbi:MAG: hypothetical protein M1838_004997 [Thelocarpon superellum]|nr:MAG: hypothetical protein M1838_004997 [Thelocarpon superellum]
MTRLLLSTSNVMNGGPSIVRRIPHEKSNIELTNSLRLNFAAAQEAAAADEFPATNGDVPVNGNGNVNGQSHARVVPLSAWTTREGSLISIPSIDWTLEGLAEERSQYDITVKLFYLPGVPPARRAAHTKEALALVLRELKVSSIDLLIVSFPGVAYESEVGCKGPHNGACSLTAADTVVEDIDTMLDTWRILEKLQGQGMIARLGVCEFGTQMLQDFLLRTKVRPAVDQINFRSCCAVPRSLFILSKREAVELLTHSDCTNILPRGTLRELLGEGERGADVLTEKRVPGRLQGDVEPQWVVKYTAVVQDRGVVENKGYFALADLHELGTGTSA